MGRKAKTSISSSHTRQSARLAQTKKEVTQALFSSSLEEIDSASTNQAFDEGCSDSSSSKELREVYEQIQAKGTYTGRFSLKHHDEGIALENDEETSLEVAQTKGNPKEVHPKFGHESFGNVEKEMAILGKNNLAFQHVPGLAILGNEVDNTKALKKQLASLTSHERDISPTNKNLNSNLEEFPPLLAGYAHLAANKADDKAKADDMARLKADMAQQKADVAIQDADVATQRHGNVQAPYQRNGNVRGRKPWFTPTTTEPTTNWKGLFAPNIGNKLKLKTYPFKKENGRRIVEAPPEDTYLEGEKYWKNCLVGQFLGPPPPLHIIRGVINKAWRRYGEVEVKSNGRGLYIFKFETEFGIDEVMQQLWHIYNRPLLLRRWEPNMEFVNFTFENVPIWVKFRNVPLSLWSSEGLSYVATHIGEPIQMDTTTEARTNLEFGEYVLK